uniref:INCENP_ARK-bind domain-containing protein n=1 Tax=Syphacia muris TaxID=451379 RepID=A0A0N5AVG7_9BILA
MVKDTINDSLNRQYSSLSCIYSVEDEVRSQQSPKQQGRSYNQFHTDRFQISLSIPIQTLLGRHSSLIDISKATRSSHRIIDSVMSSMSLQNFSSKNVDKNDVITAEEEEHLEGETSSVNPSNYCSKKNLTSHQQQESSSCSEVIRSHEDDENENSSSSGTPNTYFPSFSLLRYDNKSAEDHGSATSSSLSPNLFIFDYTKNNIIRDYQSSKNKFTNDSLKNLLQQTSLSPTSSKLNQSPQMHSCSEEISNKIQQTNNLDGSYISDGNLKAHNTSGKVEVKNINDTHKSKETQKTAMTYESKDADFQDFEDLKNTGQITLQCHSRNEMPFVVLSDYIHINETTEAPKFANDLRKSSESSAAHRSTAADSQNAEDSEYAVQVSLQCQSRIEMPFVPLANSVNINDTIKAFRKFEEASESAEGSSKSNKSETVYQSTPADSEKTKDSEVAEQATLKCQTCIEMPFVPLANSVNINDTIKAFRKFEEASESAEGSSKSNKSETVYQSTPADSEKTKDSEVAEQATLKCQTCIEMPFVPLKSLVRINDTVKVAENCENTMNSNTSRSNSILSEKSQEDGKYAISNFLLPSEYITKELSKNTATSKFVLKKDYREHSEDMQPDVVKYDTPEKLNICSVQADSAKIASDAYVDDQHIYDSVAEDNLYEDDEHIYELPAEEDILPEDSLVATTLNQVIGKQCSSSHTFKRDKDPETAAYNKACKEVEASELYADDENAYETIDDYSDKSSEFKDTKEKVEYQYEVPRSSQKIDITKLTAVELANKILEKVRGSNQKSKHRTAADAMAKNKFVDINGEVKQSVTVEQSASSFSKPMLGEGCMEQSIKSGEQPESNTVYDEQKVEYDEVANEIADDDDDKHVYYTIVSTPTQPLLHEPVRKAPEIPLPGNHSSEKNNHAEEPENDVEKENPNSGNVLIMNVYEDPVEVTPIAKDEKIKWEEGLSSSVIRKMSRRNKWIPLDEEDEELQERIKQYRAKPHFLPLEKESDDFYERSRSQWQANKNKNDERPKKLFLSNAAVKTEPISTAPESPQRTEVQRPIRLSLKLKAATASETSVVTDTIKSYNELSIPSVSSQPSLGMYAPPKTYIRQPYSAPPTENKVVDKFFPAEKLGREAEPTNRHHYLGPKSLPRDKRSPPSPHHHYIPQPFLNFNKPFWKTNASVPSSQKKPDSVKHCLQYYSVCFLLEANEAELQLFEARAFAKQVGAYASDAVLFSVDFEIFSFPSLRLSVNYYHVLLHQH